MWSLVCDNAFKFLTLTPPSIPYISDAIILLKIHFQYELYLKINPIQVSAKSMRNKLNMACASSSSELRIKNVCMKLLGRKMISWLVHDRNIAMIHPGIKLYIHTIKMVNEIGNTRQYIYKSMCN